MKKSVKTLIWGASAIVFTIAVSVIDTKVMSVTNTQVGFAVFNQAIFDFFGTNEIWDMITDILMGMVIVIAAFAAFWGLARWAKDAEDSKKIGKMLVGFLMAGGLTAVVYLIFDKLWIVNYRPVLVDGLKDPSFPSTHVLIAVVLGLCSAILLCKMVKSRTLRIIINTVLPTMIVWMMLGRVMAGAHWITDVLGALCYGMMIVSAFQWFMEAKYE